ncbi:MAG TPA: AI-2E family transporter [Roseiflexaceae bacterium]|jgi:predicted PurR-regulated permease PerM
MRRLVQIILTIAVTLLGILLLWVFRPTLALFGGSLALSAALRPLVGQLEARGVARGVAILIWYLLILAGLVVGVLIYGVGLSNEINVAAERLPRFYDATVVAWQHGSTLEQMIARGLPDFNGLLRGARGGLVAAGGAVVELAGTLFSALIFVFAVLSLSYYWLSEATHFERLWLSLLPVGARVRAREIWRNTEGAVGAYIRSTIVAVAVAGVLLLALYTIVGLPFRALLALLGGLAQIVPSLGPALGLIPAVLVGLTVSPLEGAIVLVGGTAIQVLAQQIAMRRMKAQAVKVNPLLQVLLLLALADLGGFPAIIFGPPLAALIQVLYANLIAANTTGQLRESAFDILTERLERLRTQADPRSLELASTLKRSDELLRRAQGMLEDGRRGQ